MNRRQVVVPVEFASALHGVTRQELDCLVDTIRRRLERGSSVLVAARQAAGEDWPLSFALWIAERIVEEGDAEFHISNENDENPGTKRVDIDGDISDFVYGTFERLWHAAPVWVAYVGLALMLGFALSWYGIEAAIQAYMRANGLTVMRVRILLKLLAWAVLGLSGAFILCLPVRILLDAAARRRKR